MNKAFPIILLAVILSGCINFKLNLASQYVPDKSLPKLIYSKPIFVKNASTNTTETQLCAYNSQFKVFGKLSDLTNSALGTVKEALGRQRIIIDENADNVLDLSVNEANCLEDAWGFKAVTILCVRTGDGLERKYKGESHFGNAYATSWGFETAIVDSVSKMMNDKEIIRYIQK